jgi:hypothetical protein
MPPPQARDNSLHPSPPAPSAHTLQTITCIPRPQASTPTTPHRIQARTHQQAPKDPAPQAPRGLAQMRIRAPARSSQVSCGIFSSAGASDAAPSGPIRLPASIAARPLSTHLANHHTHPLPSSAYRDHTTSHPSAYPTARTEGPNPPKQPRPRPMRIRAPPRPSKVSCGIFSSAGASDAAPSGPIPFPASIAARPLSTHLANRRKHRPPSSAYPNHTTLHPSAYPTARTNDPDPPAPEASPKSESPHLRGRAR